MNIIYCFIGIVAFLAWIGFLIWDNYSYYNWRIKIYEMKKQAKKKANEVKLNWPENLPRFFDKEE